jgi:hypothetical protein
VYSSPHCRKGRDDYAGGVCLVLVADGSREVPAYFRARWKDDGKATPSDPGQFNRQQVHIETYVALVVPFLRGVGQTRRQGSPDRSFAPHEPFHPVPLAAPNAILHGMTCLSAKQ